MSSIVAGRLDRDPARVEGDRLADEPEDEACPARRAARRRSVTSRGGSWLPRATAMKALIPAASISSGPSDLHAQARKPGGELLGEGSERRWRHLVGRGIHEVPAAVGPSGHDTGSPRVLRGARGARPAEDEPLDLSGPVVSRLPAPGVVGAENHAVDDRASIAHILEEPSDGSCAELGGCSGGACGRARDGVGIGGLTEPCREEAGSFERAVRMCQRDPAALCRSTRRRRGVLRVAPLADRRGRVRARKGRPDRKGGGRERPPAPPPAALPLSPRAWPADAIRTSRYLPQNGAKDCPQPCRYGRCAMSAALPSPPTPSPGGHPLPVEALQDFLGGFCMSASAFVAAARSLLWRRTGRRSSTSSGSSPTR